MLIYLQLYIIQKIPLFVFLIMAVISILSIISRGNSFGRSVWPIPSLITYCTCRADTYFFRGSFSKGKSEIIVTDTTLWVKFPILPFDSTADYITRGAIMLNTTGEECAPDICLFNHIYSDSVFLLTPDGLNLTLFCVRANMRRLWKM